MPVFTTRLNEGDDVACDDALADDDFSVDESPDDTLAVTLVSSTGVLCSTLQPDGQGTTVALCWAA